MVRYQQDPLLTHNSNATLSGKCECCPRTGAKNCVEEPKFNDDGNWW